MTEAYENTDEKNDVNADWAVKNKNQYGSNRR